MNNNLIVERLSIVKQLFRMAASQADQPEPTCYFAILTLHDCVEMFIKLVGEKMNVDRFSLMEYWKAIPQLTMEQQIDSLNKVRKSIKHHGLLPAKKEVAGKAIIVEQFLIENVKIQFSIEWDDISLVTLVRSANARKHLIEAEQLCKKGDYKESIYNTAYAFHELLNEYEENKKPEFKPSPFNFGKNMRRHKSHYMNMLDHNMKQFVDDVSTSIDSICDAIKILSFGIDYKKYAKFQLFTPHVIKKSDGAFYAEEWHNKKWSQQSAQFCIEFVVESALKLQEFDFDADEVTARREPKKPIKK